ncbi:MAG: hypothetical protein HRF43_03170 [Phycisphaerae bacterium]|jgi:hypothetical protein
MLSRLDSMWQDQAMQPGFPSALHVIASGLATDTRAVETLCGRKVNGGGP